jgi:signal transduction histidine kinase/AmiR/NasT family two-component response regulator
MSKRGVKRAEQGYGLATFGGVARLAELFHTCARLLRTVAGGGGLARLPGEASRAIGDGRSRDERRMLILSTLILLGALTVTVALGFAGMTVANVARAYVAGEAHYSRAQKEAVIAAMRFASTRAEEDRATFQAAAAVIEGDRRARIALEARPRNLATARQGFREGGNAEPDVGVLVAGFQLMQDWAPFAAAVQDWRAADQEFAALTGVMEALRGDPSARADTYLVRIARINARASGFERRFSRRMSQLARAATSVAYFALGVLSLVVGALGVWAGLRVHRAWVGLASDLADARDRAEQASRAKAEFLANVSHEIRTPLNGVLGMVQVMRRDEPEGHRRAQLDIVSDAGQALQSVLDSVLDLAKIEAGRLDLDTHEFELADVMRMATAGCAAACAQKHVAFETRIAEDALGRWRGDSHKLRQVLSNLLSNALKFTSTGWVRLEVKASPAGLSFAVADSGVGISPDKHEMVFDAFAQADASTTRQYGGTGLGLAISRRFVALMGGRLELQSALGEGSVFSFELPLERITSAEGSDPSRPAHVAPRTRILAAEDNPTNRLILAALLEPFDVQLSFVGDGAEAVEAWASGAFDVILMDAQMPVLNGPDAAREIRARESVQHRPRTPILALTANVMRHHVEAYRAAGMDGIVAKPLQLQDLLAAIAATVSEAATSHSSLRHPGPIAGPAARIG